MFRRSVVWGRPLLRRPRLLATALVAGMGYALGRSGTRSGGPLSDPGSRDRAGRTDANSPIAQLQALSDLHAAGSLTDDEFRVAKKKLLGL